MLRTVFRLWSGSASAKSTFFLRVMHNCPQGCGGACHRVRAKTAAHMRAARHARARAPTPGHARMHRSCAHIPVCSLTSSSFSRNSRDAGRGPSASAGIHCTRTPGGPVPAGCVSAGARLVLTNAALRARPGRHTACRRTGSGPASPLALVDRASAAFAHTAPSQPCAQSYARRRGRYAAGSCAAPPKTMRRDAMHRGGGRHPRLH